MTPPALLDRAAVAARLGVHPDSITRYRNRGEFPEPDATFGRSPAWLPETIDTWKANRPGKTGRPRKASTMATLELSDTVDRMAYEQLWAETFPGSPCPSINQGGRLGYELTTDWATAERYGKALLAAGYEHVELELTVFQNSDGAMS